MSEEIIDEFVNAIAAPIYEALGQNQSARFLIALSGGPDSTALLLAMHRLAQNDSQIVVEAAHINHHLRGDDSEKDESFCREICSARNIPLRVLQDITDNSAKSEDALRERRYSFLRSESLSGKFDAVLTAHTKNDQAETILFRLIRGTSLKGLAGIKVSRILIEGVRLVRPMLSLSRVDVLSFLSTENVIAREDGSNSQMIYSRNFIRHVVLKPIDERFAGASERIAGFTAKAAADNDYIERQAEVTFQQLSLYGDRWDLDELRYLHQSLLTRIFALGLQHREIAVDSARIEALQAMLYVGDDYRISLDATWDVNVDRNHIQWLNKDEDSAEESLPEFEAVARIPGMTPILDAGRALKIEFWSDVQAKNKVDYPAADALEALVDLSNFVGEKISLRRRKAGDYIQPFGMSQNVRLKKYLHTRRAHRETARLEADLEAGYLVSQCIVLACGQEILWVPGIGLSERVKVRKNLNPTHKIAIVKVEEKGI